jgi:preprotein translocase subunit YajC
VNSYYGIFKAIDGWVFVCLFFLLLLLFWVFVYLFVCLREQKKKMVSIKAVLDL